AICFFFQAEDGIRDFHVTGVQTCALPIFLAKTKKIVVVALAQARRESADRENGVPRLSDLAESSALEKDPNIVLTVATPHVDDPEHERSGETIINVAKNRGGPLGE